MHDDLELLEQRLLWARWEIVARREMAFVNGSWFEDVEPDPEVKTSQRWLLASLSEPRGHLVALHVSTGAPRFGVSPVAQLFGAERLSIRLGRELPREWHLLEEALDRLRTHPHRVSVLDFTVAGLRPGPSMEDLEQHLGGPRESKGWLLEENPSGEIPAICDCMYDGDIAVRYFSNGDGRWWAGAIRGPSLEDAGRIVARAGCDESVLRDVFGPGDRIGGDPEHEERDPPQWESMGVHVWWTASRKVRGFRVGWVRY